MDEDTIVRQFVNSFQLCRFLRQHFKYGDVQKKMLAQCLKYFHNGGSPVQYSSRSALCGSLTDDDVGAFAYWKHDPNMVKGKKFDQSVQKAIDQFGQTPSSLYRGVGQKQYETIAQQVKSKKPFHLVSTQSFTRDYKTAVEFAKHGGGSIADKSHGSGGVIGALSIDGYKAKAFYIDEFEFYVVMCEMHCSRVFSASDPAAYAREIDQMEVFDNTAFEDEWLIAPSTTFTFFEEDNGELGCPDLMFEIT